MLCPIQIINNRPSYGKYGYNGNLNMFDYGITDTYKNVLIKEYLNIGNLAQNNFIVDKNTSWNANLLRETFLVDNSRKEHEARSNIQKSYVPDNTIIMDNVNSVEHFCKGPHAAWKEKLVNNMNTLYL